MEDFSPTASTAATRPGDRYAADLPICRLPPLSGSPHQISIDVSATPSSHPQPTRTEEGRAMRGGSSPAPSL